MKPSKIEMSKEELLARLYDSSLDKSPEECRILRSSLCAGCSPETRNILELTFENHDRLIQALRVTKDRLDAAVRTPHVAAVVVEAGDHDQRRVKVSVRGAERVVSVDPDLKGNLQAGDAVVLNHDQSLVLSRTSRPRESSGDVATFDRRVGHTELLVKLGGNDFTCLPVNGIRLSELRQGDAIVIDRPNKFALHKLQDGPAAVLPFELETVDHLSAADVGGLDDQLRQLREALMLILLYPELAVAYRLDGITSILLTGPSGTGKTLLAKVAAAELGRVESGLQARFVSIKPSEWISEWVGAGERSIRETFAAIRKLVADGKHFVCVFFDEVESFGVTRGRDRSCSAFDHFTNSLLTELDGIKALRNVAIIGATNRPDMLDPALRSRLSGISLPVPTPLIGAARQILGIHLRGDDPWESAEIRTEAIEDALSLMYAPNSSVASVCRIRFSDGSSGMIKAAQLVSGRMLAQIGTAARRKAALRSIAGGAAGITSEDVEAATVAAIDGIRTSLTKYNVAEYITTLPQDLAVVAVDPIAPDKPQP